MKRFIGTVISILTVAAAGVSVQAATVNITGAAVKDAETVTVTLQIDGAAADTQYALLVEKADASGSYTLDNAVYINQITGAEYAETGGSVSFDMKVAADNSEKYMLRVGGTDAKNKTDSQVIGEEDKTPPTGGGDEPNPPVGKLYGDADANTVLSANDAAVALKKAIDDNFEIKAEFELVDVDGNGHIDASDAALILSKVLNAENAFPVES